MKLHVRKEIDNAPDIKLVRVREIPNMGLQLEVTFKPETGWGSYHMAVRQSVVDETTVLRFQLYTQLGRYNNSWIDLIPETPLDHRHTYNGKVVPIRQPEEVENPTKTQMFVYLILDPDVYGRYASTLVSWTPQAED